MATPATRESKPRSTARDAGDGQARNARRVTGPLAGAVLGPTVCGGCERGRWHRTIPTTGLFQRDGGWFGLGGGVFVAEEGLIEGFDAGREPSIQAVDAGVKRRDMGAYFLAELDQVRADGFKSVRPPSRVVENDRSPLLCSAEASASGRTTTSIDADAAGAYLQTHRPLPRVLEYAGTRETRFQRPFCASFWRRFARNSPRRRIGGIGVRRRVKTASPGRKAQGNEGDLRAELSMGSLGRPAAVPFPAAAISVSTRARCSDAARAVTTEGEGGSGLFAGTERSGALVGG